MWVTAVGTDVLSGRISINEIKILVSVSVSKAMGTLAFFNH